MPAVHQHALKSEGGSKGRVESCDKLNETTGRSQIVEIKGHVVLPYIASHIRH